MSNVGEWKFVIENWDNLLKNDKKTIIRTLRIGIPDKYRKIVWSLLTESKKVKEKTDFSFNYMLELPSSSEDIINCDVPRTFSMDVKNRDSRMVSLKDVLIAYSNADPGIGYVQGMNFVAGMFVCYQDTETAFWSFYSLMQRSHRDLFVDQFKHLRELGVVITHALERKLPKVHQKFEELEISPLLYSPIWFNSCFIPAELDQELTLFLFDEYLAFGETI
ncbi:ecotropic viral integration site [Tritrichomonas foetus]|uniref:Ecotropic viral integration site n=1 Tax=Tritrichomonas foetus TaxID=1144522 RepID=A0A1J4J6Y5_9EUKA|nr:ecotropic viral integration site [Tritrichomonas foetus]|eukprot:OHS94409.1 ecotropic viral integration site [Tritrichomonas foetus]